MYKKNKQHEEKKRQTKRKIPYIIPLHTKKMKKKINFMH